MQPNDPIGITSVHNIMRKATQSNLSSFHEAGLISRDSTLPIQNILNVTKNKDVHMIVDTDDHNMFRRRYLHRKFSYYVVQYKSSLYLDKNVDIFWGINRGPSLVRFYTNYKRLIKDCRTLEYIRDILILRRDLIVNISSDFVGIIDIVEKYPTNEPDHKKISEILDIEFGIDGILEYTDGVVTGSNLDMVSRLNHIDKHSLWSNDIRQVEEKFGIEAARNLIFSEIKHDYNEAGIIADYMAYHGKIYPFNKYNPDQIGKGILSSMSFEQPNHDISKICLKPMGDDATSVYSQSMIGMKPKNGTNNPNIDIIKEE